MAHYSSHLSLVVVVVVVVVVLLFAGASAGVYKTPLILDTCQKTPYSDLCVDTLSATKKASDADLFGLAEIAIEASVEQATKSAGHASELLKAYHPPTLQQCISDCTEIYEDVVDQLNDAIGALDKPDLVDDAVQWLTAAMSEVDTCEQGCNAQAVEKNVLTKWNAEFQNVTTVAMAIVKLLPMNTTDADATA